MLSLREASAALFACKMESIGIKHAKEKRKNWSKDERWLKVRAEALKLYGPACLCCGSEDKIQVDHIKPKSKYPALAFDLTNLQVLCWPCNSTKNTLHETDYRTR